MVSLLERFYEVDSGSITIDGVDLKELSPSWLRGGFIGFIGQVVITCRCFPTETNIFIHFCADS